MFVVLVRFLLSIWKWYPRLIKDKALAMKDGKPHLYGIEGYVGLAGQGKTMAVCKRLRDLRKKYGDEIEIATNFYYDDEDWRIESWEQLLKPREKCLIVVWDELPTLFNSRKFKSMPIGLIQHLTQLRKGNGILLLWTAQDWFMVDKYFRDISNWIYECRCWFGCFNVVSRFDRHDYKQLHESVGYQKRMRVKPLRTTFVQDDDLRNSYNSYQFLDSVRNTEYMDREEIAAIKGYR